MKHYTETISADLAEKLKEKGMPILIEQEWYGNGMPKAEKDCHKPMTKYCEVFDWLMEKGVFIDIYPMFLELGWKYGASVSWVIEPDTTHEISEDSWHEAANAAIEKALTLI